MLYKLLTLATAASICGSVALYRNNKLTNPTRLWSGIIVNHALYTEGSTNEMVVEFAVFNDGSVPAAVNPCIDRSTLVINGASLSGKDLDWFHFNLGNGPRSLDPLPAGKGTGVTKGGLGQLFPKADVYTVVWKGDCFESQPVSFRVMPR